MTLWMTALFTLLGLAVGLVVFLRWGTRWGSTPEERTRRLTGDAFLEGGPRPRVVMTRAITIAAPSEHVWPWLAQLARGAGFYSIDWLDNGGRASARHIVSWVPEPRLGDATPIGYLRHIDPGAALVWWAGGLKFAGAWARMVVDIRLTAVGKTSRLLIRISADASGPTARIALLVFQGIDTIMARRQLVEIKERVERHGARSTNPEEPETGARDQYQLYETIYASGAQAGVKGRELAARWRKAAIADGVLEPPETTPSGAAP